MIYETQRVAAKKRHLFKCEWTGSSSAQLCLDLSQFAQLPFECAHGATHGTSQQPPGGHHGHWIIACVEPFWGPAVVYFSLTCSVAARGRWQNFCSFLFCFLFLLSCCCQSARRGETRWGVHMDPSGDNSCCFCVDFEVASSSWSCSALPAAAANKLTVKRNEREIKWTRNNQRVELKPDMQIELKHLNRGRLHDTYFLCSFLIYSRINVDFLKT